MIRCKDCKKLIGIEVEIEKVTFSEAKSIYQTVTGVYTTASGRKVLDLEDPVSTHVSPEIVYQCDFCGCPYSEKEVILIMEELAALDKEE